MIGRVYGRGLYGGETTIKKSFPRRGKNVLFVNAPEEKEGDTYRVPLLSLHHANRYSAGAGACVIKATG